MMDQEQSSIFIAIHIGIFFVLVLTCHGELARRRPAPQHLTAFYMWMSAGGMIGGIATGLIAPYTFNWIAEYPILIALAVLCRPGLALPKSYAEQIIFFGALGVAVLALVLFRAFEVDVDTNIFRWVVAGLLIVTVLFWRDPLRLRRSWRSSCSPITSLSRPATRARAACAASSAYSRSTETYDGRFRLSRTHHAARRPTHPRQRRQSRHRPA